MRSQPHPKMQVKRECDLPEDAECGNGAEVPMPGFMPEDRHAEDRPRRTAEERESQQDRLRGPPCAAFRFPLVCSVEKKVTILIAANADKRIKEGFIVSSSLF